MSLADDKNLVRADARALHRGLDLAHQRAVHVRAREHAEADPARGIEAARRQQQPVASGGDQVLAPQPDARRQPRAIDLMQHQRQVILDQARDLAVGQDRRGDGLGWFRRKLSSA